MAIKVSVIIPAFNVEKYISKCFESLINQTMNDFEIICVDDASTDGTYEIAKKYEEKYLNIKVKRNVENKGAGLTRNTGLKEAKGEYVIFLDADDTYLPELLSKMYDAIIVADADISICKADFIDGYGNILQSGCGWNENLIKKDCIRKSDDRGHLMQAISYPPWYKLVRKSFLFENNIWFQDLPNTNDVYYSIMIEACAKKIVFVKESLILYQNERAGSLTEGRLQHRSYITWAFEKAIIQLRKRNMWSGDIQKSVINLVIDTCYGYVADEKNIFAKQCLIDYRERIMPLLLDEEVQQNVFSKWEYYQYLYLCGKISFKENKYQLCSNELVLFLTEQKRDKLALWGAGKLARQFLVAIPDANRYIQYIVDNDVEKQGSTLSGIEICAYESVKDIVDKYLVLNERYIESIRQQVGDASKLVNMKNKLEELI